MNPNQSQEDTKDNTINARIITFAYNSDETRAKGLVMTEMESNPEFSILQLFDSRGYSCIGPFISLRTNHNC